MNRIVLDASAILAVLNQESGADKMTPELLNIAVGGTVNLAEVQGKLVENGLSADEAWEATCSLVRETIDFTPEQAKLAGALVAKTRSLGLSLGDRACLALALILDAPVYTTDKSWKKLQAGIRIQVIR
jgi:ribonuclease VapC